MTNIELSIVIASYNTKDITLSCLKYIKKYGPDFKFEVIVVDDGSTDGSVEELKKVKNIKLILNNKNLGYVRTNNKGIRNASGKYILLLNSDTQVKRDSINNLLKFAQKTLDAGVVGSQLLNLDNSVQESCYHFPSIINTLKGMNTKYYPKSKNPSIVDGVVGAVFLITPQALKKVGLLDEKYISYYEDIDYCKRVHDAELKVYYLPTSQIYHHHGASFKKLVDSKNQWRKLIPSSKLYHGVVKHYIIYLIMWLQQKWQKYLKILK